MSYAEGTKQLSPIVASGDTSIVMLNTNTDSTGNFAEYNGSVVSRLNIRIKDFNTDTLYIGLSREYNEFGVPDGFNGIGTYCFRIKDPNGVVVHGPFSINSGNANADSWELASNGPDVLNPSGYDTQTEPYAMFLPSMNGDFYIEFTDNATDCSTANPADEVDLKFFDFTVVSGGVEQPGRLWSLNWALISPSINPNTPPECQFDRPFNGTLYSYTTDGFVSKIDFDSSGFQGLKFNVAFGKRGPSNLGSVILDRMSVNNADSTAGAADHMVFISEPDITEFPSSTNACGDVALLGVQCLSDTFCFNVGITQPGQIEIILDFDGDGEFTADTVDVILAEILDVADTVCIGWNGLKGDGSPLGFGETLPAIIRYSQGVQHYAAYDVELLKFGFCVETVRPICPGIATDLLYWDDSNIADDVNTPNYDESDPGTGQPAMQLNGCQCGNNGCRTWTNVHVDGDTSCIGQITGYGDRSTLNTWWFASTTIVGPLELPFVSVAITGDSSVCMGGSTEFTAVGTPDTIDYLYAWTGPGMFMTNTASTGMVSDPGVYYVTITDTVSNCSASDSITLVLLDLPMISLNSTCVGPNQQNSDIDLTVSGMAGPFTYLWSNGAMTEDLFNVPPDTYTVTVTDTNGCQAIDSITLGVCCTLDITCPPINGGHYTCADDIPAANTALITINDYCDQVSIDVQEMSNGATGCGLDTLVIMRVYSVTDGAGNTDMCIQMFTATDDVPPAITCPADVTVDCDADYDPTVTGVPTINDNCTDQMLLNLGFVDSGSPGSCINDPAVIRTWTVTDLCGNSATCSQSIFFQDTTPPSIVANTCPSDTTIDCGTMFVLASPSYTDNCTSQGAILIQSVDDSLGFDGSCLNGILGTITRTYYGTDACGNVDSSCVVTISVQDTIAPVLLSCPADTTVQCAVPAGTLGLPTYLDNCSDVAIAFLDDTIGFMPPALGMIVRTFYGTDACGNVDSSCMQTITIQDTVPPECLTQDITVFLDGGGSAMIAGDAVDAGSNDACGLAPISVSPSTFNCGDVGVVIVTQTVTDFNGNTSTCTASVSVFDTTAPVCATLDITVQLDASGSASIANDDVDNGSNDACGIAAIDVSPSTFSCADIGVVVVTQTVTDVNGNTSTCTASVTVEDNTGPQCVTQDITVQLDATGNASIADDAVDGGSGDACGVGSVTVTPSDFDCGDVGSIIVTQTVVDNNGNVSTCTAVVTVEDNIAPECLTQDITVQLDAGGNASIADNAVDNGSNDACGIASVTVSPTDFTCADLGVTIVTQTVTDVNGNVSSCTASVTVVDNIAPECITQDITVQLDMNGEATIAADAVDNGSTDNCGVSSITVSPSQFDCNDVGVVLVTQTVADASGNESSCTALVTVEDNIAPNCLAQDITIQLDASGTATIADDAVDGGSSDACGIASITISQTSFDCEDLGVVVVTQTVTDNNGNTSTCSANVTVEDNVAPTIDCPADITVACAADVPAVNTGDPEVSDNCAGVVTVGHVGDVTSNQTCANQFTVTRTYQATDQNGNTAVCVQTITVNDDVPPTAVCQDITIDFALANSYTITPDDVDGGSFDNCGDVTLDISQSVFECTEFINNQTMTIQLTVTDECGNTDVCDAQITGIGGGGVVIDCPDDIIVNLGSGECSAIVDYVVTASSLCGGPGNIITIQQVDNSGLTSGDFFPIGVTLQQYIAFNQTGDTASCEFTITVIEGPEEPFLVCNDTVQISLDQNCQAIINPDIILEGGTYGCFDDFFICVEGIGCDSGEILITMPELGCYTVTITNQAGNSCWGTACFEDKLPPVIECMDVTINCGESTDPVFTPVVGGTAVASASPASPIGPNAGTVTTQDLQINVPAAAQVTDVNITIDLDHTFSSDLDVFLIGPDGTMVELATDVCGGSDNWDNVTFDDEAAVAVTAACMAGPPALTGSVRPEGFLGDFDGLGASGTWTLQITDDAGGDAGILNSVSISIDYLVSLPYAPEASDACGDVTLVYTDQESGELCENVVITRTWIATDESGNTAQCVQTITILPLTLAGLEFPENYIGSCGQSSHPDNTGYPTLNGEELDNGFLCNIFLTWEDHPLADCGGGIKIVRTWTVLDWCTLEIVEGTQVIKLTDDQAPVLTCPPDQTVSTDPWFCNADVNLIVPNAYDLCGTPCTLSVAVSNGTLIHFGGNSYRVDNIPLGITTVTWTAEDACGNESSCTYDITVEDLIPPVPLCDEHTVVALTTDDPLNEGLTKIYATTFDDGSYDNCGPVTFLARRMDSCIDFDWIGPNGEYPNNDGGLPESIDKGLTFQPWVPFACCDVGNIVMVELRVTDQAGNINSCMVEVDVQDKLPPYLECPPDITLSCSYWFDPHETSGFVTADGLENIFGRVLDEYEYDDSDRQYITINDPENMQVIQPHTWGRDGWANDNCNVNIDVRTRIYDDCTGDDLPGPGVPDNAVRLVERTFRAQDGQGNTSTCRQRIWIVDFHPFYITDQVCGLNNADDVRWPCDLLITNCPDDLTPDGLSAYAPNNRPIVKDDNCSLIGVTYDDQVFHFIDGLCLKIVRTWTVIDWCQFDPIELTGYWQYVQVIKVNDQTGPQFEDCPASPLTLCTNDPGITLPSNNQVFLGEDDPNSSACSVHVLMTKTVYETCSDEVVYDVKVFPFNGTEFVQVVAETHAPVDDNNNAVLTFNTQQNSLPSNHPIRRYGLPYNDKYCSNWPLPGGSKDYHRILWSVNDGCGNSTSCSYLFRLEDCKKPTPVCVGLSSVVMPSSGCVTIWAKDFDASSFDDCTSREDLLFSFSDKVYQPSRVFCCEDIEANGSPSFLVEIWAADEGNDQNCNGFVQPIGIEWEERNKDFCTTFVVIDDNENVCPGGPGVGGIVETEEIEAVEKVKVQMTDQSGQIMSTFITDKDGKYRFTNPLLTYTVKPGRNDDHKNGVSTLDLVGIQKHLLGLKPFTSPYKLIAADANNSESVSALDLVEIRKLILGLYVEFPKNTSWRFVDANFEFDDPSSPWPFAESIELESGMSLNEDFVGIKVGDVNGTVAANASQITTRGARHVLDLILDDRDVKAGDQVEIPVYGMNFEEMVGFQMTLETKGLTFTGVESGAINMPSDYVAAHDGAITMSWANLSALSEPVSIRHDAALFTLHFTATTDGSLSTMLAATSRITAAEAYRSSLVPDPVGVENDEEILDIALQFVKLGTGIRVVEYALYQNEPNPFSDQTLIGFELPEAMPATMIIYDLHGRVVFKQEGSYNAGYNEIYVKSKELRADGAYYYRLNAGDFTATKKFILSGK